MRLGTPFYNKISRAIKRIQLTKQKDEKSEWITFFSTLSDNYRNADYEPIVLYCTVQYYDKIMKGKNNYNPKVMFFTCFWVADKFIEDDVFSLDHILMFANDYSIKEKIKKYEIKIAKIFDWNFQIQIPDKLNKIHKNFDEIVEYLTRLDR